MIYQRNSAVESAPIKDETILYHPDAVRFCTLNGTAAFLWEQLATPRTLAELLGRLSVTYRVDRHADAERELEAFLGELAHHSFVERIAGDSTEGSSSMVAGDVAAADYATPRLRMMDEAEVLAEFQVTSAGITWWAV
jgi:hypothetical protein